VQPIIVIDIVILSHVDAIQAQAIEIIAYIVTNCLHAAALELVFAERASAFRNYGIEVDKTATVEDVLDWFLVLGFKGPELGFREGIDIVQKGFSSAVAAHLWEVTEWTTDAADELVSETSLGCVDST
jgi:hypothetical protein